MPLQTHTWLTVPFSWKWFRYDLWSSSRQRDIKGSLPSIPYVETLNEKSLFPPFFGMLSGGICWWEILQPETLRMANWRERKSPGPWGHNWGTESALKPPTSRFLIESVNILVVEATFSFIFSCLQLKTSASLGGGSSLQAQMNFQWGMKLWPVSSRCF